MSVGQKSFVNTLSEGLTNGCFEQEKDVGKPSNQNNGGIDRQVLAGMADEALLKGNGGTLVKTFHEPNNGFGHTSRLTEPGLELHFQNLNFQIKDKQILHDVSGTAHPGKVLAVMGPSGSGKTTLLNILGGRVKCSKCNATIGGQPLTKRTRRKISYVLQQDIFFPNLTLEETLMFSAQLRLPESMSTHVKHELVQELIQQLDMEKCTHTIIGDNMSRGLSGGEKKRANIANELLTDPAVLLLDEPTSGLDSSTAYALTLSLKKYAVHSGKTVMMTIHQPSVQMFFTFDTVLLLSGGRVAYYGAPRDVLNDFALLGYSCDASQYNPADFILDVVKSGDDAAKRLISACNLRRLAMPDCPILKSTVRAFESEHLREGNLSIVNESEDAPDDVNDNTKYDEASGIAMSGGTYKALEPESAMNGHVVSMTDVTNSKSSVDDDDQSRWPTSASKQINVLTVRSFIQGKYRYLSKLKFIKTIGVAIICGLVWFQAGRGIVPERVVPDLTAALFFVNVFNAFNSLFDVLVVFPSEREVINKERMSGSYRLSSYYIAKTLSEIPLAIVLPTISTVIVYWMAGLNGFNNVWAFFGTYLTMILVTFTSQSLGIFISASTMDFDHGLVLAIFMMITFMLLGGFYIKNIPSWLSWLAYLSPMYFSYVLMIYLEFDSNTRIECNTETSAYPSCVSTPERNSTGFVEFMDIHLENSATVPAWACVVALLGMFAFYRIVGYIMLRFFHKPEVK